MSTLALSCLTTSNLSWFMDLAFQVPVQYCSLQHQTVLPSPVTSTTGCCFCFGSIPSFFLELFLHWSPLTKCGLLEKGMANNFSILALRTPWTVWEGKKIGHWKMSSPGREVPNMLLEISEEITPERMKVSPWKSIKQSNWSHLGDGEGFLRIREGRAASVKGTKVGRILCRWEKKTGANTTSWERTHLVGGPERSPLGAQCCRLGAWWERNPKKGSVLPGTGLFRPC